VLSPIAAGHSAPLKSSIEAEEAVMLLSGYRKQVFTPECNPNFVSVNCIAHLNEDVTEAIPYLNAVLGGFDYIDEPRSVTFRAHGKLLTVHGKKIAVNALKDGDEADKILGWLVKEINDAWEKKDTITPSYEDLPKPGMMQVLRHLPMTNCKECGQPTCMVFAIAVTEGSKEPEDCVPLAPDKRQAIEEYMAQFDLDF
jgi:ArsR family metal-binding transcriptional regulator